MARPLGPATVLFLRRCAKGREIPWHPREAFSVLLILLLSLVLLHGPPRDAIEGLVESTARGKPTIEALYDES